MVSSFATKFCEFYEPDFLTQGSEGMTVKNIKLKSLLTGIFLLKVIK